MGKSRKKRLGLGGKAFGNFHRNVGIVTGERGMIDEVHAVEGSGSVVGSVGGSVDGQCVVEGSAGGSVAG